MLDDWQKKLKKQAKREQEKELFGYTNENNPFGDANLTNAFVWKKKYERQLATKKIMKPLTKQELMEKQKTLRNEVDKVKERRRLREEEKKAMDIMREQMEREAMAEQCKDWEEKEEKFHISQARTRSVIRIREGREKAVDILSKNLNLFKDDQPKADLPIDLDVELTEPHRIFDGLVIEDMQSLEKDIKNHIELGADLPYWNALHVICQDNIQRAINEEEQQTGFGVVQEDIVRIFEKKSRAELANLEHEIHKKLEDNRRGVEVLDTAYWECILKQIPIFKAKAYLREFHRNLLNKRLLQLKHQHLQEQKQKIRTNVPSNSDNDEDIEPKLIPHEEAKHLLGINGENRNKENDSSDSDDDFSPELLPIDDHDDDIEVVDAEQDRKELEAQRRAVLEQKAQEDKEMKEATKKANKGRAQASADLRAAGMTRFMVPSDEVLIKSEMAKGMKEDESKFGDEIKVPNQTYWWHDKYRPRKPRYFNRVRTGYEWNKYNQTHYDKENPPPKIVQGYKFNIFYPDLIDVSVPPSYYLKPCPNSSDYCTIHFTAGPPYEDIAFKIVKKEWEYNHKRGFKCVFDRGVLHLYFGFQRYRYRR